jgi:beta-N-acetylhexosaminidase
MNIRKIIIGMLLIIILAFAGCSIGIQDKDSDNSNNQHKGASEIKEPSKDNKQQPDIEIDPIKEQINSMTIEEKVGQMVIVGVDGYTVDNNATAMIEKHHVGGFILFGRNVQNAEQLLTLINSLKIANSKNNVPLFISVDEEGGRVSRMPDELVKLPSNKTIGQINSENLSYKIGSLLAEEIKAFGFNMNFAPVLDVNSNPQNPVIGDRSFGSDEKVVSRLGVQTMVGLQANYVIPVVKHFPGHGDTSVDSHIGLPFIGHDMNRLASLELVPFKKAIDNQADAVMIAHILLSKIDAKNPASLSKTIITYILREQLGFKGVVITDDMTMGAIVENYNIGEAAILSVNAGSDIILVCHGYDNAAGVIDALIKAVEEGVIKMERINESVYRVLELKNKYKLTDDVIGSVDVEKINKRIKSVLDAYLSLK